MIHANSELIFSEKKAARSRSAHQPGHFGGHYRSFRSVTPFQFVTTINPANVRIPPPTPTSTPLPFPTSVNGGHIVFTCTRNNINQICLINADGTGYKQLTNGTNNTYYPAISRDGKSVVFAINKYDNFDLYLLNLGKFENDPTYQTTWAIPSRLNFRRTESKLCS